MFYDSNIKATAASIERVDIEEFLTQVQDWQQSLNRQRSYDDCIISAIDGLLDIFFECCEYIKI